MAEIHLEFDRCTLAEDEDERPEEIAEQESLVKLENIRKGFIYFQEHNKDTKHIHFLVAPYFIDIDELMTKLFKEWVDISFPRIILSAITQTEDSPSDIYREISRKLVRGLVHALHSTEMWLCTDGLDYGFSRDVGRAFDNETSRRKTIEGNLKGFAFPETVLIGICSKEVLTFSEQFNSNSKRSEETKDESAMVKRDINKRYGYFIFIEDASETRRGVSDFLLNLTSHVSKEGVKTFTEENVEKVVQIPVICLLLHGKMEQIDLILGHLKRGLPLVVFEGSGGLADLVAYAYHQSVFRPEGLKIGEYTEEVLKPELSVQMHIAYPGYSDYQISLLTEKVFACIRCSKQQKQEFITVLNIHRVDAQPSSLASHLLRALYKSQRSDARKDDAQMKKDLFFAMDWNCADVAREEFFASDIAHTFPVDGELFFRALTKPQREDFVSLLLDQGFSLHKFLNSDCLKKLFQNSLNREFFRSIVWESVLGFGSNVEITTSFLDNKLMILLEELTGIPSLLNCIELDWNSQSIYDDRTPYEAERKAVEVLALWAILSYRIQLVKIIWRHSEQPIHIALACSIILRKLEAFVTDLSMKNEMNKQSKEFSMMAVNVLTLGYDGVPCRAIDLLNEKNRVWSFKALMEMAAFAKNKMFLAHACCQKYLDNIFMGNIRIRDLTYGDITIPLWLKIILSAFLIFPIFFWVRFEVPDKSKASDELPAKNAKPKEYVGSSKAKEEPEEASSAKQQQSSQVSFPYKVYYLWSAPITKFWVCQVFYVFFLFLFSLAVIWPACGNVFLDFFTCIWLGTIIIDSIYHTYTLNLKYTSMPLVFKCLEASVMTLFLFGYAMGRIIWRTDFMSPYSAKVMLCIALLYFYYRLIFIALPISSELGPMLFRVKRMIVVDFSSYIRVTILVIICNGFIIHAVIYPDYPLNWELVRRAFYDAVISFFLTPAEHFGIPNPKCIRLKRNPVNATTFIGLPDQCKVGRYFKYDCPNPGVWPYLFGLQYLIILRLILFVLLFALFSNTQRKLEEEGRYIWKYQRYELIVHFSNRLTLPPPLSMITLTYMLFRYLLYSCCNYMNKYLKHSKLKGFKKTYHPPAQDELDESDFRYWKKLALQIYNQQKQEADEEITTEKRVDRVNALTDALNSLSIGLKDLKSHLKELQFQKADTHQFLESAGLQITRRERLRAKNVPQIFSRISPYPNTMIPRYPVSDNYVPWKNIPWTYDPMSFTLPKEDFPPSIRPHVDPDIQKKREDEGEAFRMPLFNWNKSFMTPAGDIIDRLSWIDKQGQVFEYEIDSEGLPKNPRGRTGMKGRGCLPRWGPNHYIYVIITRWHAEEEPQGQMYLGQKYLEVILMSSDSGLSLPGNYVHTESRYEIIRFLFDAQGVWKLSEDMVEYFESLLQDKVKITRRRSSIWQRLKAEDKEEKSSKEKKKITAERLKLGYMDEETNTDQAWCEAEVWHLHYNSECNISEKFKADMEWYLLIEENLLSVPIGQAALLHSVAKNMKIGLEVSEKNP